MERYLALYKQHPNLVNIFSNFKIIQYLDQPVRHYVAISETDHNQVIRLMLADVGELDEFKHREYHHIIICDDIPLYVLENAIEYRRDYDPNISDKEAYDALLQWYRAEKDARGYSEDNEQPSQAVNSYRLGSQIGSRRWLGQRI